MALKWLANKTVNPRARLRCFAFPCGGAGASYFRNWSGEFSRDVDFLPIQLPGREGRFNEPRVGDMHELLSMLEPGLTPYFDVPFVFFGHSLGAMIAFELGRKLHDAKQGGLRHIMIAAFRAPHLPSHSAPMHLLPDDAFITTLIKFGGIPEAILANRELLGLLVQIARKDFQLHETYVYQKQEKLTCPITAFGGQDDPFVRPEQLDAWREESRANFNLHVLSGNHHFIQNHRKFIIEKIQACS